jgi:bifunctional diaminopimelate decarboxylase / aspartate kinase
VIERVARSDQPDPGHLPPARIDPPNMVRSGGQRPFRHSALAQTVHRRTFGSLMASPRGKTSAPIVLKFGGTSVSSEENWSRIATILTDCYEKRERPLVVLSAFSGVTTLLEEAVTAALAGDPEPQVARLRKIHEDKMRGLPSETVEVVQQELGRLEGALRGMSVLGEASPRSRARVLATGEILSSRIVTAALRAHGVDASWLDAREVLDSRPVPGNPWRHYLSASCDSDPDPELRRRLVAASGPVITQGFVARDPAGETVVLGRGSSDTSAAYLAARLKAARLEIWTDVPGMFTADPQVVPEARLLVRLNYSEAQEIATTGSKVLHPACIPALRAAGVPIHIRSTFHPEQPGTVILADESSTAPQLKAISVQRDVTLVVMETVRLWQEVGFLADVFVCFRDEGISVDLVSASETSVTVSLNPQGALTSSGSLERLLARLKPLCDVHLLHDCAAVSLVGSGVRAQLHRMGPVLETFEEHRVHFVSQAANDLNLTFVVDGDRVAPIARKFHEHLIGDAADPDVFGPSWSELRGHGVKSAKTAP